MGADAQFRSTDFARMCDMLVQQKERAALTWSAHEASPGQSADTGDQDDERAHRADMPET